jgi:hypothetical protein
MALVAAIDLAVQAKHTLRTLEALPAFISLEIDRQVALARNDAMPRIDRVIDQARLGRLDAKSQAEGARKDAKEIAESYRKTLDTHLTVIESLAASGGDAIEKDLRSVTAPLAEKLPRLITTVNQGATQINAALPLYLDCDSGNCLYNHLQGTARAIDRASVSIERAMPQIAANTIRTTEGLAQTTENTARLTRWCWGRLIGRACKGGR